MWLPIKSYLTEIFFPIECVICGQAGQFFCADCQSRIIPLEDKCFICNNNYSATGVCDQCRPKVNFDKALAIGYFSGTVLEKAIENLKFNFIEELAKILANLLSREIQKRDFLARGKNSLMIPVPLHPKRFCERGFNQSELLARELSSSLSVSLGLNHLERVKETKQQARLNREERQQNVRDAFVVKNGHDFFDKIVYIVDDVFTSGATFEAVAQVVRPFSPQEIIAVALAHG